MDGGGYDPHTHTHTDTHAKAIGVPKTGPKPKHGLAFVWPLCEEAGVLQSKNVSRHAVVGQALAHTSTDCRRYETLS